MWNYTFPRSKQHQPKKSAYFAALLSLGSTICWRKTKINNHNNKHACTTYEYPKSPTQDKPTAAQTKNFKTILLIDWICNEIVLCVFCDLFAIAAFVVRGNLHSLINQQYWTRRIWHECYDRWFEWKMIDDLLKFLLSLILLFDFFDKHKELALTFDFPTHRVM